MRNSPTVVTFFEEFRRNFSRIISCNWSLGNSREIPQNWSPRWKIFVRSQFREIPEKFFGISTHKIPQNFSGIPEFPRNSWENLRNSSQELVRKNFFAGNSQTFPQILSTFSPFFLQNWLQEIPWNWLQEISWIELWEFPRNGLQEIPRTWFLGMGYVTRNSSTFPPDFSWEFPRIPRKGSHENFHGFSAKLLLGKYIWLVYLLVCVCPCRNGRTVCLFFTLHNVEISKLLTSKM